MDDLEAERRRQRAVQSAVDELMRLLDDANLFGSGAARFAKACTIADQVLADHGATRE